MQTTSHQPPQTSLPERIAAVYQQYLQSLLAGDRQGCGQLVSELLAQKVPIKELYLDLFQQSLYQVGELWAHGRISVAKEHLATAITESMLTLVYPTLFRQPRCGRSAVVACVTNEYHQLGAKMVADIIEMHGWDGYFYGANTPLDDLLHELADRQPDLLCLSISISENLPALIDAITRIRQQFPGQRIVVGGQAFHRGAAEALEQFDRLLLLKDIDQLEQVLLT